MAEETKGGEPAPVNAAAAPGEDSSNARKRGGKRESDQTPIEELYDLTKPLPTRVERPSKEAHDKELADISAKMDALKEERRVLQDKIDVTMDAGKNTEMGREREALNQLKARKGRLIDEKKVIRSKLDETRNQADKLAKDRKDARSGVRFTNLDDINKEIAKLTRRQETTSMSLNEEKRLIKEMDALHASKALVADLKTKETSLEDVKEQRKSISAQIAIKDKEIDAVQKDIDIRVANIKAISDKETDKRGALQALFQQRDDVRKAMNETLKERDACRLAFREKNNEWYNYQRAIRAQKKMQYEEEKKKRDEERAAWLKQKQEEEAKKIPYEQEMALCDYLANYLTNTYLLDAAEAEQKRQQEEEIKKSQADVVAVKEDPFAGLKPVSKKEEEGVYFQTGKSKKKGKSRAAKKKATTAGPFTLDMDTFEQFGLLNLTPPTRVDMVEKSVQELKDKKKWYSEQPRGSVPTAVDIRKANEKAAAKLRSSGGGGENGAAAASAAPAAKRSNKAGGFDLSNDDFAPLTTSGAAAPFSINASWGQKPAATEAPAEEPPFR